MTQPDDASFLIQIEPFLRALNSNDRLAAYLEDIRDESERVTQVLEEADAEVVPELIELREELAKLRARESVLAARSGSAGAGGAPGADGRQGYRVDLDSASAAGGPDTELELVAGRWVGAGAP